MIETELRPDSPVETTQPATAPAIKVITSLEELQAMATYKFYVDITLAGQDSVRVEGRHLTPAQRALTKDINDCVVPPLIKGATASDDRHDFNHPAYIKERNRTFIVTRSMEIYWAYEFISKSKPNLKEPKDIAEFIQSILNEAVITALYAALKDGGLRKVVLVNFTSADSLLN